MKLSTQIGGLAAIVLFVVWAVTGAQPALVLAGLAAIVAVLDFIFSSPELPAAIAPEPTPAPTPAPEPEPVKKAPAKKAKPAAAKATKATAKKPATAKKTPAKKTAKK